MFFRDSKIAVWIPEKRVGKKIMRGSELFIRSQRSIVKRYRFCGVSRLIVSQSEVCDCGSKLRIEFDGLLKSDRRLIMFLVLEVCDAESEKKLWRLRELLDCLVQTNDGGFRCSRVGEEHAVTKTVRFVPWIPLNSQSHCRDGILHM